MKIATRVLGCALVILTALNGRAFAAGDVPKYRPDVVIVKLKPGAADAMALGKVTTTGLTSLDLLSAQLGVTAAHRTVPDAGRLGPQSDPNRLSDFFTFELPQGSDVEAAVAAFAADPSVLVAEPDYIMPLYVTPNDTSYSSQWSLHQLSDVDIDAESAWELEVGDSTVKVGVLDSGVKWAHPDLNPNIWVNPGEDLNHNGVVFDSADINGIDDDGDGYVDDLIGWDFLAGASNCDGSYEDCNLPDNDPTDIAGHGSHVSGIIAATTGNRIGVAGIAGGMRDQHRPGVKIMCLRAGWLAADGIGYVDMVACSQGFTYAVAHGVSAINCSWGSSGSLIYSAAENAIAAGVVVCVAAGNDASSTPGGVLDTAYGTLAVASLDQAGKRSGFSNYGTWVDISAPGSAIYNTFSNKGVATYATLSGTSMASPTVLGVAALLKSHHPWFTNVQIDSILLATADPIIYVDNPTFIGQLGTGRVDAYKALVGLTTANFSVDTLWGKAPLTVHYTNTSPNAPNGPYKYTFGDGDSASSPNATHTYNQPGLFTIKFTGSGPSGPHTRIRPEMIAVLRDTIQYVPTNVVYQTFTSVPVPVRLHNTHPMKEMYLPFLLSGTPTIYIDSITKGPRATGWTLTIPYDNSFFGEIAAYLAAGNAAPLPAGDGIVAYLWVRSAFSNTIGQVKTVDSSEFNGSYWLRLISNWVDFRPDFAAGTITIVAPPCNCPHQGDMQLPDGSGAIDVQDVLAVIKIAFSGGTDVTDPACPKSRADVNNNGVVDVNDVLYVIKTAFTNGPAPVNPCGP